MKMLLRISIILFALVSNFLISQTITGKIKGKNNEAIQYAEIILSNEKDSLSTLSNEEGNYKISTPNLGEYTLDVFVDGEKSFSEKLNISSDLVKNISIVPSYKKIDEVVLTKRKKLVEQKIDRTVYNVENAIANDGGDAIDALSNTPKVVIQNDEIKIAGKSSIKVLVNDKIVQLSGDDLINYLKSIPSSSIQKIEVITTPPAKYEAEGNSGLINIVLKSTRQNSWNGSVRVNYTQATRPGTSEGINFSYNKDKFSIISDLSYWHSDWVYTNDINYIYPAEKWKNDLHTRNISNGYSGNINLGYKISEKSDIGLQYIGSTRVGNSYDNNTSRNYIGASTLKDRFVDGHSRTSPYNYSLSFNFNRKIDSLGKKYSIILDYFNLSEDRDNEFSTREQNYMSGQPMHSLAQNNSSKDISNYSGKIDFELPLKWAKIEFGGKASFTKTDNIVEATFHNILTTPPTLKLHDLNNFEYTENNQALYFSANKEFGEKIELKAGLRGEYTQYETNSISSNQKESKKYFKIFPTIYALWKIDDNNDLSLNFSRRINRPSYWNLDPARRYDSEFSYVVGDPFLQPSFSYNYEIKYSIKDALSFNIYLSDTKDGYSQVVYHDTTNGSQIFRNENYYDQLDIGGGINFDKDIYKWWNTSTELEVFFNKTDIFIPIYDKYYCGWGGYFYTNNTFNLNSKKTVSATLAYWYDYPSRYGEGEMSEHSRLDLGIKFLFLDKKLSVSLNVNDIFNDNISTFRESSKGIDQSFRQSYDTRRFRLSLNYKFGNQNLKVNKAKSGNEEERERAN